MRILAVNWLDPENPEAGGAEIHLFEILKRLVAWGHEVTVVCSGFERSAVGSLLSAAPGAGSPPCPRDSGQLNAESRKRTTVDGISVHRVGGRHTFALKGRGAVRRVLRERSHDIVLEDINKLPLFLPTLTDLPAYVIVPHLFGTTAFQQASLPIAAVVWLTELPIPWVYRHAQFQAISDSTKADLVRRGVSAARIRVIYPGVDSDWYCPGPMDEPTNRRTDVPSVLYIGRLKRYKGIDTAIRAIALTRERGHALNLVIAGTGDDRPRLEALAREMRVEDRVQFVGVVSEVEKRRLYRQAWATVLPSAKEGWGLTNVEAAACGTPAVAADRPGLRETVKHGETGFLVPHGDAEALAGALLRLADDPGLVGRLGAAARRFAESLSWNGTARETERHLEETIDAFLRTRKE